MMNTRETVEGIKSFINSPERFLLVSGNKPNHTINLVFSMAMFRYSKPAVILLRSNVENLSSRFLLPILKSTNMGIRVSMDSFEEGTWHNSLKKINIAIIFPVELLRYKKYAGVLPDILQKDPDKVFLVSKKVNPDLGRFSHLTPVRLTYYSDPL